MRYFLSALVCVVLCASMAGASDEIMRVIVPVADVRSEPKDAIDSYVHDPLQETQLLFGETVVIREWRDDWALVEVPGQAEYTHKKQWEGYPGWVRRSALSAVPAAPGGASGVARRGWSDIFPAPAGLFGEKSDPLLTIPFGSRLSVLGRRGGWMEVSYHGGLTGWMRKKDVRLVDGPKSSEWRTRLEILKNAQGFIRTPYYWGGLSPYGPDYRRAVTGVDCSGLAHVAYRAAGLSIPRDSHEQWMVSRAIRRRDLRRGDLVFLANAKKPDRVVHVMIFAGGEYLIEGPGTGQAVRRVTFKQKLGQRLSQMDSGDTATEKVVYFGRLIPTE
ncbi:MAG: hypothetical protein A3G34_15605 [Candidatus Lindowbacteria bacterium RIFCSPLOWO2_12_FULL_62_27]|nr:MAG: hypothetical protein A3G34_15605 [Candidatus Lindowbacteria bacterium RIFCSPLOWO2_12_FULL_62_27]